jgi:hypothetical protein
MPRAKNLPANYKHGKKGEEKRQISDMSEDSDAAKSARERYIRVAAMDIMANEGTWNIYVDKTTQYQLFVGDKKIGRRNVYHLDPMRQTPAT